jgi:Transposase family tnp2
MLRHPADSPEWTSIDKKHGDFASDPKNLRIELCTDKMNPYGNMSSRLKVLQQLAEIGPYVDIHKVELQE